MLYIYSRYAPLKKNSFLFKTVTLNLMSNNRFMYRCHGVNLITFFVLQIKDIYSSQIQTRRKPKIDELNHLIATIKASSHHYYFHSSE